MRHPEYRHDPPDPANVSTRQLCQAAGITYRQADYWTRQGYLLAADGWGTGSGCRRYHPATEVTVAAGLAQLLRAGCAYPAEAAEALRRLPPDTSGTVLLDEHGMLCDALPGARWVVQLAAAEMAAA